jgi:hypothetical protein
MKRYIIPQTIATPLMSVRVLCSSGGTNSTPVNEIPTDDQW